MKETRIAVTITLLESSRRRSGVQSVFQGWGQGSAPDTRVPALQPELTTSSWSCSLCAQLHRHAGPGFSFLVPLKENDNAAACRGIPCDSDSVVADWGRTQYSTHHIKSGSPSKSHFGDLSSAYFQIPASVAPCSCRVYSCIVSVCHHSDSAGFFPLDIFFGILRLFKWGFRDTLWKWESSGSLSNLGFSPPTLKITFPLLKQCYGFKFLRFVKRSGR